MSTTSSTYPLSGRNSSKANGDEPEGWKRARRQYFLRVLYVVFLAFLSLALVALLIVYGIYLQQEVDRRHSAHHQRDIHLDQVRRVIEAAEGSGLPWYEYMEVPSACLNSIILREEIEHGLRPQPVSS